MSNPQQNHRDLAVAVVTTSGRWPTTGFDTVPENQKIKHVLQEATKHLHLAGTEGWIATVGNQTLNPDESFAGQGFTSGQILIDFGPRQGGGGCA